MTAEGRSAPRPTDGGAAVRGREIRGVAVVGVSHHTAPVAVRERFALPPAEAAEAMLRLAGGASSSPPAREAVVLSTCNRTEIYLHLTDVESGTRAAGELLAGRAGLSTSEAGEHLYTRAGAAAVEHLFRVVGSLDSMVLGEAQIQGQVRSAYNLALEAGAEGEGPGVIGPVLSRLFEAALSVGGRIRDETDLGSGAASVASAAVKLAGKIFGSLEDRHAVVVGAGEMSELALECFARERLASIRVANRSPDRARILAGRVDADAISLDQVWQTLRQTDVLVMATGAPHRILTRAMMERALPGGPSRPLFVLDIAIPRDVEAAVGEMPNVFLYDIDDLQQIVGENLDRRRAELPAAERILEEESDRYMEWLRSLDVVPVIRALRERGEDVRRGEVERILQKLDGLDGGERAALEQFSHRLLNKLLHEPTVRLRTAASNGRGQLAVDLARYLFDLDEASDHAPGREQSE